MLPRHLRSFVLSRQLHSHGHASRRAFPAASALKPLALQHRAQFHTSHSRHSELPKSPFAKFVEVLKEEIEKSRELQDDYRQVQGDIGKVQDSETLKRARSLYEQARLKASIKENPRLQAAAEELRKAGMSVGQAVSEALKSVEESRIMRTLSQISGQVSDSIASTTEPLRKTAAYKAFADTLVDALDDSGSAKHAGYEEKEERRRRRARRLAKAGLNPSARRVQADPEAGEALVLHKDSAKQEKWEQLKETNPILRKFVEFRQSYDESENPVVSTMRGVTDTIGGWFEENEVAQVTRAMKAIDHTFTRESFERELREYIVPEVVDAYLSADKESLKAWCGEATYNLLWATMEQYLRQGLISDSKVLDIRQVDIYDAKMLENNLPVFVVHFSTQEILLFRNAKTREIIVGGENKVEQVQYAAVMTRLEGELDHELTGGWKFLEMARRSSRAYL